jgi:hypothetical protein
MATLCWFESGQGHQSGFVDFIEGPEIGVRPLTAQSLRIWQARVTKYQAVSEN